MQLVSEKRRNLSLKNDSFAYLIRLCENGRLDDAFEDVRHLHNRGVRIPIRAFFSLLQSCIARKDESLGRQVQFLIHQSGFGSNAFLASHLIRMYSSFERLSYANYVFSMLSTDEQTEFTWNAIISAHVKLGQHSIMLYEQMLSTHVLPDRHIYSAILKGCASRNTLCYGRKIHAHIVECGFDKDRIVGNSLVSMYIKTASIDDANVVFATLLEKDVVSWNAIISGYANHNLSRSALHSVVDMLNNDLIPTAVTFACVLKACASDAGIYGGMQIHDIVMKYFLERDACVGNSLINMYAKCGSLEDALNVFQRLPQRDVATWNAMIGAYAHNGLGLLSMELFQEMQRMSIKADHVTFLNILKASSTITDIELIETIEAAVIASGFGSDVYIASSIIDMYFKHGSPDHASSLFRNLLIKDIVTWNTMFAGYVQHRKNTEALQLMQQMFEENTEPDEITFMSLLKAVYAEESLQLGKLMHACILEAGLENKPFVRNSIIDMYVKIGSMDNAYALFDRLSKPDCVSWNVMISGHVQHNEGKDALRLFGSLLHEGVQPSKLTFIYVLRACSYMTALDIGSLALSYIIESAYELDFHIRTAVIEMYAYCARMDDALLIFCKTPEQDIGTWNALILGYVQCEEGHKALQAFEALQHKAVQPNDITFIVVLQACSNLKVLEPCRLIHDLITKSGFDSDSYVMITLIDAYAKCGHMAEAFYAFRSLQNPGVVAWTVMISGYVENMEGEAALSFFTKMQQEEIEPNQVTFICILKACWMLGALDQGMFVHTCIIEKGFGSDEMIGSAIMGMYSSFGSVEDACKVFTELPKKDTVTWNSLITGSTLSNNYGMALRQFHEMEYEGFHPDVVMFTSLLSACSHLGLMEEGCDIFESIHEYGDTFITPDHVNCLVDIFGRGGLLAKAEDVLQSFPLLQNCVGWKSLLGHCQTHGNFELARRCFKQLIRLGDNCEDVYRIMLDIFSGVGTESFITDAPIHEVAELTVMQ